MILDDSISFRELIEESQHKIYNKIESSKTQGQTREILNTNSCESGCIVHDESQNVQVAHENEFESFQISTSDLILEVSKVLKH